MGHRPDLHGDLGQRPYVCFMVDASSRMIVRWLVAAHMRTEMVLDPLEIARRSRGTRLARLVAPSARSLVQDSCHACLDTCHHVWQDYHIFGRYVRSASIALTQIAWIASAVLVAASLAHPQLTGALAWSLSATQLFALWSLGFGVRTAWLTASSIQLAWALYGAMTGQAGFVAACAVGAGLQFRAYLKHPAAIVDDRRKECQNLQ